MAEKFNLKWNDFQTNVSKSFGLFRNEEYLHDVTIVSDDEQHISAHKVVLSASSEFFKNILKKSQHASPMIYLSGVTAKNLSAFMDYIYQGEVQLYQEELDSFLNVAQTLKIDGLINNDNGEETAMKEEGLLEETKVDNDVFNEEVSSQKNIITSTNPRPSRTKNQSCQNCVCEQLKY